MTFLDACTHTGFASAAGVGGELLLKATAVLAAALMLDFLLHRRWLWPVRSHGTRPWCFWRCCRSHVLCCRQNGLLQLRRCC